MSAANWLILIAAVLAVTGLFATVGAWVAEARSMHTLDHCIPDTGHDTDLSEAARVEESRIDEAMTAVIDEDAA